MSETSNLAKPNISKAQHGRERIVNLMRRLKIDTTTAHEIAEMLGEPYSFIQPRVSELKYSGVFICVGKRVSGPFGKMSECYALIPEGQKPVPLRTKKPAKEWAEEGQYRVTWVKFSDELHRTHEYFHSDYGVSAAIYRKGEQGWKLVSVESNPYEQV